MQSPQQPFSSPPIPAPDEQYVPSTLLTGPRDWKSAPKIVKSWAYQLTWLAIVFLPLVIVGSFFVGKEEPVVKLLTAVLYGILWGVAIYLNRAFKKGARAAWTVQLVLSCLGVLGFPIGTLIHGYILSQWFKPETKAWFGLQ